EDNRVNTYDTVTYHEGIKVIKWIDPYTDINKTDNDIIREVYTNEEYQNHLRDMFKQQLREYNTSLYQLVVKIKNSKPEISNICDSAILKALCGYYIKEFNKNCVFSDSIIDLVNAVPLSNSHTIDKIVKEILQYEYFYGWICN